MSIAVINAIENQTLPSQQCNFVPGRAITFSHPQSIESNDEYYAVGILSLQALTMTVDYINTIRCGIKLQGQNYSILLQTYSDKSNEEIHEAIGYNIVNRTDFMLAGYSSDLTATIAPIAESNSRILVAGGSSRTSVYVNRSHVFGILPPSDSFLVQAFAGLSKYQPKTVAYMQEDGVSSCKSIPDLAPSFGLELVAETFVPENPNSSHFDATALNMSQIDPDIMITCVYANGCGKWIKSMRSVGWSPKAQVFTVCIGSPEIESDGGADVAFMMGTSSWDRVLPPIPDAVTGWTPRDFAEKFETTTFRNASYQHTAAATALSVLVQAIELSDSIDSDQVSQQLSNGTFNTMYGETKFDENGQNSAISWLIQYDESGKLKIVYPNPKDGLEATEIVYPMPNWYHRDCLTSGNCKESGGSCNYEGTCSCDTVVDSIFFGYGALAFCKIVPVENMNYVSNTLVYISVGMLSLQLIISGTCIIWTLWHRNHTIVKASQPVFLHFISLGCIVLASSIIPTFFQGAYRYLQNPSTGGLSEIENHQIQKLDAACMAFPWLAGLGFVIVFSALFAKIQRVQKLISHAERFSRKKVEVKDVISIMIVMISIEFAILLAWQLVAPLRWQREVLSTDGDGFPIASVGFCSSDRSLAFTIPLAAFNALGLIYALYLCWVTRNVPSDFAEGSSITLSVISIFQIMLLTVPILIIASENAEATFFVRSGVVFLMTSTVSLLIFGPKMWKLRQPDSNNNRLEVRKSKFSTSYKPDQSIVQALGSASELNMNSIIDPNRSMPFDVENAGDTGNAIAVARLELEKLEEMPQESAISKESCESSSRGAHFGHYAKFKCDSETEEGSLRGQTKSSAIDDENDKVYEKANDAQTMSEDDKININSNQCLTSELESKQGIDFTYDGMEKTISEHPAQNQESSEVETFPLEKAVTEHHNTVMIESATSTDWSSMRDHNEQAPKCSAEGIGADNDIFPTDQTTPITESVHQNRSLSKTTNEHDQYNCEAIQEGSNPLSQTQNPSLVSFENHISDDNLNGPGFLIDVLGSLDTIVQKASNEVHNETTEVSSPILGTTDTGECS